MSSPHAAAAEMAKMAGYDFVVLDIEHGAFDLKDLERFIPLLRGLGLEVLSKVLAAERGPIQQALDFGSDAVVIPHIQGAEHAAHVCGFAKFPPLGDRSYAGGRVAAYGGFDDAWVREQDRRTKCFPMVEGEGALREIAAILALPVVDGVFVGPSDLSLRRERGAYARSEEDFTDIVSVAEAAAAAGKPWILPAWSPEEKALAREHGAAYAALTMEHGALFQGLRSARAGMEAAE
ncbi:HpcH/HpaI aldolase family protein [Aureimonas populi]|uniref:HpcH/HpaI aldolase/citrate lyase family protein n=1 Tax=Aureimonas populi TaxID=1701758 RepID=A0ABW5CLJ0_9HYPH|nr:aldolase/citrate lyase family protein [Aureimonas populi]